MIALRMCYDFFFYKFVMAIQWIFAVYKIPFTNACVPYNESPKTCYDCYGIYKSLFSRQGSELYVEGA
jgi:hypothetical protein